MSAKPCTVAIVGLGLIGGSLARDLVAADVRVIAYDRNRSAVGEAIRSGVVAAALPEDLTGIEAADAVVVALPVDAVAAWLEGHASRISRIPLVTDTGSTKAGIVAAAERVGIGRRFVGAHPLAGHHRSGWGASRTGLFADAPVYLCSTYTTSAEAFELARRLWAMVGGRVAEMDAGAHDRQLAWTSHLPQTLSSVLAAVLSDAGIEFGDLGPGGRGMVRLAASSPEMWTGILRENAREVTAALAATEAHIASVRGAMERGDGNAVAALLAAGHAWTGRGA